MDRAEQLRRQHVCSARRVVVKVGTNVLAPAGRGGGGLDGERVGAIARQVASLVRSGRQVAVVSSGAIGCGVRRLGLGRRPRTLPLLQAAASVGQGELVARYAEHLRRHGLHGAQILLTRDDFDSRRRYLNACNTIHALFELSCVPIINENDTISTDEINFGDNDQLAALLTHLIRADLLVLLTCVPGLYAERPGRGGRGVVLEVVERIDEAIDRMVYQERTPDGLGGMASKVEAVKTTCQAGAAAVIADGRRADVLSRLFAGERVGTLFLPQAGRISSYKRWLRFTTRPRGALRVDRGARAALVERGKSLLPSGIVGVEGEFQRGDVVRLRGPDGEEFARGLTNYSSAEVERIMGCHSSRIAGILGQKHYDEVVHRDNMALLG